MRPAAWTLGWLLILSAGTGFSAPLESIEAGALFGSVTDLLGNRVAEAKITLYRVAWEEDEAQVKRVSVLRTDSDGRFRFGDLPAGQYMIRAWLEGFATTRIWELRVDPNQRRLVNIAVAVGDITPTPPTKVNGEIRGSDGTVLSNAAVTLRDAFNAGILLQTGTNAEGRFILEPPFCGEYVISAFKPGFKPTATVAGIECARENAVSLSLRKVDAAR